MKRQAKQSAPKNESGELGAPATLARLEKEELSAYGKIEDAERRIAEIKALPPTKIKSEVSDRSRRLSDAISDLELANDLWNKIAKTLLTYKKGVSPSEREGEKVMAADVKEWFAQLMLSIDLAIEATIKADAQSAALCDSPEAFFQQHTGNYRAAKRNALESAIQSGVLPKWISE